MVKQISEYSDEGLLRLFNNAIDYIEKGKMVEEAKAKIKEVELEWDNRLKKYLFADERADRPKKGMLQTIGYKTGNDGLGQRKRRLILDHLIIGSLPFCGSPAYMAEWGYPNSKKRYRKLRDVLNQLIFMNQRFSDKEVAVGDWEDDLKYLKTTWKDKFL